MGGLIIIIIGVMFFPQAYKTLVEKEGTEGALPGLGLTEDQLFFVGFARVSTVLFLIIMERPHYG